MTEFEAVGNLMHQRYILLPIYVVDILQILLTLYFILYLFDIEQIYQIWAGAVSSRVLLRSVS